MENIILVHVIYIVGFIIFCRLFDYMMKQRHQVSTELVIKKDSKIESLNRQLVSSIRSYHMLQRKYYRMVQDRDELIIDLEKEVEELKSGIRYLQGVN